MGFNIRSIMGRNSRGPAAPAQPSPAPGRRPPGASPRPGAQAPAQSGPARPIPNNPEMYAARFTGDNGRSIRVSQTGDRAFTVSHYKGNDLDYSVDTDEVYHDPKSGRLAWNDNGRTSAAGTSSGYVEHDNRPGGHGFGKGGKDSLKPPTWAGHFAGGTWNR